MNQWRYLYLDEDKIYIREGKDSTQYFNLKDISALDPGLGERIRKQVLEKERIKNEVT